MATTPGSKPAPLAVRLIHERDTKRFAVYSADPQGIIVQNTLYVTTDIARALGNGTVPDCLTMTLRAT